MTKDEQEKFSQFCRSMWLDHCDENKTPHSTTYTEEEYRRKFLEWIAIGLLAIGVTVAITFVIWLGLKNRGLI